MIELVSMGCNTQTNTHNNQFGYDIVCVNSTQQRQDVLCTAAVVHYSIAKYAARTKLTTCAAVHCIYASHYPPT